MLPAAMAMGKNHIGTMAGKLNGQMMPTGPEGLADGVDVDLGRGVLGEPALEQMRDAAGELDDLLAAADLAEGVGDDLAVLAGDDLGQLTLAGVEQFAEVEQDLGALGQRGVPPRRERRRGGVDHRAGVLDAAQRDLTGDLTGRRVRHRGGAPLVPAKGLLFIQCVIVLGSCRSHFPYFET